MAEHQLAIRNQSGAFLFPGPAQAEPYVSDDAGSKLALRNSKADIVYSPDGALAAVMDNDCVVIYDTQTGELHACGQDICRRIPVSANLGKHACVDLSAQTSALGYLKTHSKHFRDAHCAVSSACVCAVFDSLANFDAWL